MIQGGDDVAEPLDTHHYGCRILVGEYTSQQGYLYSGHVMMDSVEVRHCGQGGYFSPSDPRYAIAFKNSVSGSSISRCSIHHSYNTAIGIHSSQYITLYNNVVYRTTSSSIIVGGKDNTVSGNLALFTSTIQPNSPKDNHAVDFPATYNIDRNNVVRDNAAGGSHRISYRYSGEACLNGRQPKLGDEVSVPYIQLTMAIISLLTASHKI